MTDDQPEALDAFLCFDANLPRLERCEHNCDRKKSVLCIHRFEPKVQIEYCNSQSFSGWSDLRILTYFLGCLVDNIAKGAISPGRCVFMILTKDRNFIDDVKVEWKRADPNARLDLKFSGNFISCGGLVVLVQQIDCRNYGTNKASDRKCAFHKVNEFLSKKSKV